MLISSAPVAIPVSTAHPPTESVVRDVERKRPIPEIKSTSDNPGSRQSADENVKSNKSTSSGRTIAGQDSPEERQDKQLEQDKQGSQEQRQQLLDTQQITRLKKADREVRAHEAAHASVGGQHAGAPQLSYATGPDGKRYAVSGEVSIDIGSVPNNPQATLEKMGQVRRAALAPVNPSSQDLKVAAIASQVATQAIAELSSLNKQQSELEATGSEVKDEEQSVTVSKKSNLPSSESPQKRNSVLLSEKITASGALNNANQPNQISYSA